MARDVLKMKWEVVDSSIRTVDTVDKKFDVSDKNLQVHLDVAFNVGSRVAAHIVRLHNERLEFQKEIA